MVPPPLFRNKLPQVILSMPLAGFLIRNARRLRLENVEVRGQVGEALNVADSNEVTMITQLSIIM